ncbi:hypothetical protein BCR33DRAFT_722528 [Rhizoclosmatium globosum]|uniref:Uncharacterized protein n=1 Tax=Rhizoclosmatium globosum TaxID=329046 RepID=A0A1Y2BK99_9FUNG|nr:hypothetical protein BCR33DRAFT_722528 [Rhizoclosmatium globosum]|eukprot:ORY35179.1 hypothetical protein BCR33DRAFT_722528 [Rhizoclosmatium globosum]
MQVSAILLAVPIYIPSAIKPIGGGVPIATNNPSDVIGVGKREPEVEARAIPNPYNKSPTVGAIVPISPANPPDVIGVGKREPEVEARAIIIKPNNKPQIVGGGVAIPTQAPPNPQGVA